MRFWFQMVCKVGGVLTLAVLGSALRMTPVQATGTAEPGNMLSLNEAAGPAGLPMPADASGPAGGELRFTQFKLFDPMVDNQALRMLVPQGWRASGGIAWRHHASNLAVCNLSLVDPSGQLAFSYFPCDALCYGDSLAMYGFGPGSNYLGNEVCAPISRVAEFVTRFALPRYRGSDPRYRVTAVEELEDFYCTLTFASGPALPGFLLWGPERLYSFRAPKGQLDPRTPMFQAMATSMTIELGWFNKYRQVAELWAQRIENSIRDAGMLSRYIAQINDEITQINRAAWENQQRVMDRVNRQFANYIRGVEEYQNPYASSTVQLPAGYQRVWANRFNEYYLTNSASFNPNQHSNQQWVELTRVP
jgi:hypothetical protein